MKSHSQSQIRNSTLIQVEKLKNFPVILMGVDFWQPLLAFMKDTLLAKNTIFASDLERLLVTDSPEVAINHIWKYLHHENHHNSPILKGA